MQDTIVFTRGTTGLVPSILTRTRSHIDLHHHTSLLACGGPGGDQAVVLLDVIKQGHHQPEPRVALTRSGQFLRSPERGVGNQNLPRSDCNDLSPQGVDVLRYLLFPKGMCKENITIPQTRRGVFFTPKRASPPFHLHHSSPTNSSHIAGWRGKHSNVAG